jgi:carbon storage regulator CsrA
MPLVINRSVGESFRVISDGGTATITVIDIGRTDVRVVIDAPKYIRIERDDMKKRPEPELEPKLESCRKCGSQSFGDACGLCWKCFQAENGD